MCELFVMYFFDKVADPCDVFDMCEPMQENGQISENRGYSGATSYRSGTNGRNNGRTAENEHPRYKRGLRLLSDFSSVSLKSGQCHDRIMAMDRVRW